MDLKLILIGAGVICMAAAIFGGGLKVISIEVPALQSVRRQFLLGGLGLMLLAVGVVVALSEGGEAAAEPPAAEVSDAEAAAEPPASDAAPAEEPAPETTTEAAPADEAAPAGEAETSQAQ